MNNFDDFSTLGEENFHNTFCSQNVYHSSFVTFFRRQSRRKNISFILFRCGDRQTVTALVVGMALVTLDPDEADLVDV